MIPSPAKTYKTISLQTASQVELVIRMYEGAIRFLEMAKLGFDYEDPIEQIETIHNNVTRAQEIINELNMTLDMEQGGETAIQLRISTTTSTIVSLTATCARTWLVFRK